MPRRLQLLLGAAVAIVAVALVIRATTASGGGTVTVYAASSLKAAFSATDATPAYSFLASDVLEKQIEAGAPADVFASASPKYAKALAGKGLCSVPVTFATNTLVLVTPLANPGHVNALADLATGAPVTLAVGNAAVPIGAYTRTLLNGIGLAAVLTRNTVSSEPDAKSIVAKVALGSADAGFVYVTDWKAAAGKLRVVPIPASLQPPIAYQVCAVKRSDANTDGASAFIARLLGTTGRQALLKAGFGLPAAP
jgi:molybdate transport system substrate-binding protein